MSVTVNETKTVRFRFDNAAGNKHILLTADLKIDEAGDGRPGHPRRAHRHPPIDNLISTPIITLPSG
eukprot:scaffold204482_cov35-Prasinocladus_malaysianus.AAC.2